MNRCYQASGHWNRILRLTICRFDTFDISSTSGALLRCVIATIRPTSESASPKNRNPGFGRVPRLSHPLTTCPKLPLALQMCSRKSFAGCGLWLLMPQAKWAEAYPVPALPPECARPRLPALPWLFLQLFLPLSLSCSIFHIGFTIFSKWPLSECLLVHLMVFETSKGTIFLQCSHTLAAQTL